MFYAFWAICIFVSLTDAELPRGKKIAFLSVWNEKYQTFSREGSCLTVQQSAGKAWGCPAMFYFLLSRGEMTPGGRAAGWLSSIAMGVKEIYELKGPCMSWTRLRDRFLLVRRSGDWEIKELPISLGKQLYTRVNYLRERGAELYRVAVKLFHIQTIGYISQESLVRT